MRGPDIVLFAVGLVLFSGAGYGVYANGGFTGEGGGAFGAFELVWASNEVEVAAGDFTTAPTAEFAFNVSEPGVSAITVLVECAYTTPAPGITTTITATVTGPAGQNATGEGECGSAFEIPIEIEPAPEGGLVEGENGEEAASHAVDGLGRAARGDWTGTLEFAQSSAAPVPLPGPVQVQWSGSVTAVLTQWTAEPTAVTR